MTVCVSAWPSVECFEIWSNQDGEAPEFQQQVERIQKKLTAHDDAIAAILCAIRDLLATPAPKRRSIGCTADLNPKPRAITPTNSRQARSGRQCGRTSILPSARQSLPTMVMTAASAWRAVAGHRCGVRLQPISTSRAAATVASGVHLHRQAMRYRR